MSVSSIRQAPRSRLLQCMHTGTYFCDVAKELRAPISNELLLTLLLWLVGRPSWWDFFSHKRFNRIIKWKTMQNSRFSNKVKNMAQNAKNSKVLYTHMKRCGSCLSCHGVGWMQLVSWAEAWRWQKCASGTPHSEKEICQSGFCNQARSGLAVEVFPGSLLIYDRGLAAGSLAMSNPWRSNIFCCSSTWPLLLIMAKPTVAHC